MLFLGSLLSIPRRARAPLLTNQHQPLCSALTTILFKFLIGFSLVIGLSHPGISFAESIASLTLKPVQSIVIDTSKKFQGTKLGGFSGLYLQSHQLYTVTDDRGRFGEPRIYRYEISETKLKNAPFERARAFKCCFLVPS